MIVWTPYWMTLVSTAAPHSLACRSSRTRDLVVFASLLKENPQQWKYPGRPSSAEVGMTRVANEDGRRLLSAYHAYNDDRSSLLTKKPGEHESIVHATV